MRRLLLPLCVVSSASLACAHAPPAPPAAAMRPADYYPLAVGNSWSYQVSALGKGAPQQRTVKIVSKDAEGYFHDDAHGELRADADCLHDRSRRLLCAPFEKGKGWLSVVSVSSTERYEIVDADATAPTPAGRFDHCVKVQGHNRIGGRAVDLVVEWTYAPGIGLVQMEVSAVEAGKVLPQMSMSLASYHLEQPK